MASEASYVNSRYLQAALIYSQRGWLSFPVRGKTPLTVHGFHDASRRPAVLERLFACTCATGIAVATGPSRLLVVDVDDEDGRDCWADVCARHGGHSPTLTAETGSGGLHIYFSGSAPSTSRRLGPGVDTRGASGYVVAPPSEHKSGRSYRWRESRAPLAPLPVWLGALLEPPAPAVVGERRELPDGLEATAYGRAALDGLAGEMLATGEGNRNERLLRLAYRAGRLHAGGELDGDVARDMLLDAALRSGLSQREASGVFERGFLAGSQFPIGRVER